ncbi:MAG TPA: DUF2071 domain-containing protein [Phycisphaerae bacterium]|nr:DUF2071 domain-containing protein [Phycisphaerae bacterium]
MNDSAARSDAEMHVGARFLSAEWRYLLILNYEVAREALLPLVPAGTELDLFEGRALFSVVGFRFLRARVMGVAVPGHVDFDEVNLRFYVRRRVGSGEFRRGVVFAREMVPRVAIAAMARLAYNEPYGACRMRSSVPRGVTDNPGLVEYSWQTEGGWEGISATATGVATVPAEGTEAAFITEHYWGYTRQRDGGTVEYRVAHPVWRVWSVQGAACSRGAAGFYGGRFAGPIAGGACSAFVAEGSEVEVFWPRRVVREANVQP